MHFADLGDIRVHYDDRGPQDGPAVVFANALGTDFRIWDGVIAHLPGGLRLIRYDMRGHGLTTCPEAPYYMGDLVNDAAKLMEHLGVKDAVFVGLSIGGMIAQGLAAERLDLLRAIVLSNTAAKIGTHQMWHDRVHAVRDGGIEAVADAKLERWFARTTRAERPQLVSGIRAMLTRQPVEGYIGCLEAIGETDLVESTARLRLATLGIAASEDGSTPPDLVRETIESIPGSKFHLIRRAGHLACVEAPAEYAAALEGFLREVGQIA
ncbi:3-oxoadipate enol-lactonase [Sinisalibacter aestuarii]|uniref:3-oxoadipate enol-lactonase n=1 Tax=Sinisalibacter aestuarii TaxID=2949426 RepID=A0ABQ5LV55_9RHOB|nr:3-oxoadipate enol-lactonase [Sinisalibacter aestuarii]GKY88875.1 3-oxoadipate enol-lactonase [Sinisalibacter aestuarii]